VTISLAGHGCRNKAFPALQKVYVATQEGAVLVLDPATNTAVTTPLALVAGPTSMTVDEKFQSVVVNNVSNRAVVFIDAASGQISTVVPFNLDQPATITMDSGAQKLYVALANEPRVRVIDMSKLPFSSKDVKLPSYAVDIAVHPADQKIYVATQDGQLVILDGGDNYKIFGPVKVGQHAKHLIVGADDAGLSSKVYVTNDTGVAVVDVTTFDVTQLPMSGTPWAIAMNPATASLFVTNLADHTVEVFNGNTLKSLKVIPGRTRTVLNRCHDLQRSADRGRTEGVRHRYNRCDGDCDHRSSDQR